MAVNYSTNRGNYKLVEGEENRYAIELTTHEGTYIGDVGYACFYSHNWWEARRTFYGTQYSSGIAVSDDDPMMLLCKFAKEFEEVTDEEYRADWSKL